MIDDVLTTGASLKKAVDALRDKGIFCIVDRQQENNELKKNHYNHSLPIQSNFMDRRAMAACLVLAKGELAYILSLSQLASNNRLS